MDASGDALSKHQCAAFAQITTAGLTDAWSAFHRGECNLNLALAHTKEVYTANMTLFVLLADTTVHLANDTTIAGSATYITPKHTYGNPGTTSSIR